MNEPVRVLVADDHAPTRAGIRASIESHGFVVVAEAASADAAVEAAVRERPDVCLVDVNMPGDGIVATARILDAVPATTVVVITAARDDDHLFRALRAGASGYLLKDMDPDRLPYALRGVLDGEAAMPRVLVARLLEEFRGRAQRRMPALGPAGARLTAREWEVLEALRDSESTAAIAGRLGVSPVTVRSHVAAILRKLDVRDREAAVRVLEEAERDS